MSHHEALAATEKGVCVVCLGHSNSERGYLWNVMRPKLLEGLKMQRLIEQRNNEDARGLRDEFEVLVSRRDRDPFGTLVRDEAST